MSEADPAIESSGSATEKQPQVQSIEDVLRSLIGKLLIVSTPDSLSAVPLGHQIKPSCYKAKILKVLDGMAVLAAEGSKKKGEEKATTLKQYLPITTVKRICVGKGRAAPEGLTAATQALDPRQPSTTQTGGGVSKVIDEDDLRKIRSGSWGPLTATDAIAPAPLGEGSRHRRE